MQSHRSALQDVNFARVRRFSSMIPSPTSTSSAKQPLSTLAEYQKYLAMCQCGDDVHDCLLFLKRNMIELPKLFELAMKMQSVPATSAPVERVFSHGGIIMRPHRGGDHGGTGGRVPSNNLSGGTQADSSPPIFCKKKF